MTNRKLEYIKIIQDQVNRFDAIECMVRMVVRGDSRAVIVSGGAGTGKSYSVEKVAQEETISSQIEFKIVKGYMRPTALYALLYEMRNSNQVLILDDCDQVIRDEVGLNILKAALDTTASRVIDWRTKAPMKYEDAEGVEMEIPNSFEYKGSIVFVTNIDFDKEIAKGHKLTPHLEALISRASYIRLNIDTPLHKILRCGWIAYRGVAKTQGLTNTQFDEINKFMFSHADRLREISIRAVIKMCQLFKADEATWEDMARITCLKEA